MQTRSDTQFIIAVNMCGVVVSYGLLALSLYLSTEVPLATKGFWGVTVLLLTISLGNFVKYRFDNRLADDRLSKLEEAKNERILGDYIKEDVV
ncbi:MAG: hypothetical protein P8Q92_02370 [Pseudoprimorskyibacter sp.]|nr:hypothetical protein [Pseudoprimorskyibacter sp.]